MEVVAEWHCLGGGPRVVFAPVVHTHGEYPHCLVGFDAVPGIFQPVVEPADVEVVEEQGG